MNFKQGKSPNKTPEIKTRVPAPPPLSSDSTSNPKSRQIVLQNDNTQSKHSRNSSLTKDDVEIHVKTAVSNVSEKVGSERPHHSPDSPTTMRMSRKLYFC